MANPDPLQTPKKRPRRRMTFEQKLVREWVLKNRGIMAEMAVIHKCTPQFVQQVAYGRGSAIPGQGTRGDIEKELKYRGWPGIRPRKTR